MGKALLPAVYRIGLQLQQTAPTVNAGSQSPVARTVPRIDWNELLGASCKPLLGGACAAVMLEQQLGGYAIAGSIKFLLNTRNVVDKAAGI